MLEPHAVGIVFCLEEGMGHSLFWLLRLTCALSLWEPCAALHALLAADQLLLTLLTMHGVLPHSLPLPLVTSLSTWWHCQSVFAFCGEEPRQGGDRNPRCPFLLTHTLVLG